MQSASGDCSITEIDERGIQKLVESHGWAAADADAADAWVDAALSPSSATSALLPRKSRSMRITRCVGSGLVIRFSWSGETRLLAQVRRLRGPEDEWMIYSHFNVPRHAATGERVIDFTPEGFEVIISAWLSQRFDPDEAARKLAEPPPE